MFIEGNAIMLVLIPILMPMVQELGIDTVHFGLIFIFNLAVGSLSPPMGTLMFTTCTITKVKIKDFIKEAWPYIILDESNPWFALYLKYTQALVKHADGRYPVSHGCVVGPSDLAVVLRGHTNTAIDMISDNDDIQDLFEKMGKVFTYSSDSVWEKIPLWENGYYDAQYYLWAPGSIIRLQEDALSIFSPDLYTKYLQHIDEKIAMKYESCFMHLHSTSMIVLDELLDVKAIKAFEVNNDVGGPPVSVMIKHIKKIQQNKRPVIFRGSFTNEELQEVLEELDSSGLYLHIMVEHEKEVSPLRQTLGM